MSNSPSADSPESAHPHDDAPTVAARAEEQAYLDSLLDRVDAATAELRRRLRDVRVEADIDDPQGLMRRDREAADIQQRLQSYAAADMGLMFGRIDVDDEEPDNPVPGQPQVDRRYIGRIGIHDSDDAMRTLLMDWRAPQARPFYLATALRSEGVHHRRHIHTRGRRVTDVTDEHLDADAATEHTPSDVGRETALLAAVTRARSSHMRDIVETIGVEQDAIIRSSFRGVTVVQGGPGTGKTAVALHRAAYVLYVWREQLSRTGVLIIGPNDTFLSYISRVLPSLGETGVVLATPATLVPGLSTIPESSLLAREVKGSAEMVYILSRAVAYFQTVPDSPVTITLDAVDVDLTPAMVRAARTRARRSGKPHNEAQRLFLDHLASALARRYAERIGSDPLGGGNLLSDADIATLTEELRGDADVLAILSQWWPILEASEVLGTLLRIPEQIAVDYDELTWEGLRRSPTFGEEDATDWPVDAHLWTDADAPLIDELRELLGPPPSADTRGEKGESWDEVIEDAQGALDILSGSAAQDLDDGSAPEILMAYDLIDAEMLAERQRVRIERSTAERAQADEDWVYGHIIVDEAQELSPMAWRMIFRRTKNRWMTIVGDPQQTGNPAGVESWAETLEPFVADRWQLHELTVSYRIPADISALADRVASIINPHHSPMVAIRESGRGISTGPVASWEEALERVLRRAEEGIVGVITADPTTWRSRMEQWDARAEISVLSPDEAKGLEFDEVILLEPADIVDASPQGWQDVYVALTRATQGLTLLHDRDLPWEDES